MGLKVECLECGKVFRTKSYLPECPNCGGSDIDIAKGILPNVKSRTIRREV